MNYTIHFLDLQTMTAIFTYELWKDIIVSEFIIKHKDLSEILLFSMTNLITVFFILKVYLIDETNLYSIAVQTTDIHQ